jgi:hypothetical protein
MIRPFRINDRVHRKERYRTEEIGTIVKLTDTHAQIQWDGYPERAKQYPGINSYQPKRTRLKLTAIMHHGLT